MQIRFEKIDPIFLTDFSNSDNKFFVHIMGEGKFEVDFNRWTKLRNARAALAKRIGIVDKWQVRGDEETKHKKLKRLQLRLNKKTYSPIRSLDHIDNKLMLERLSGSTYVRGEVFTFRNNKNGSYQIVVNKKPTGCWIDAKGEIGSYSGGGPSVVQWVKWYGNSTKEAYEILKCLS